MGIVVVTYCLRTLNRLMTIVRCLTSLEHSNHCPSFVFYPDFVGRVKNLMAVLAIDWLKEFV